MPDMPPIDWSATTGAYMIPGGVARRWSVPNNARKRPQDRPRIELRNGDEIHWWGRYFGCNTQQLIDCVNIVGFEIENVWRYLGNGRGLPG
jgi:hypothetical protein